MSSTVDTSVVIDALRDHPGALAALRSARASGSWYASEVTRLEVLAGMRPGEESRTIQLLDSFRWVPVDAAVSIRAGAFGRRWLRSHGGIDAADLAIAATADLIGAALLTRNVRHFPMFEGLRPPY